MRARKVGEEYEKYACAYFGLTPTPGSGVGRRKGDAWTRNWFFEAKSTDATAITLKAAWWQKARKQTVEMQKAFTALGFRFRRRVEISNHLGGVILSAADLAYLGITVRPCFYTDSNQMSLKQSELAELKSSMAAGLVLGQHELGIITEKQFRDLVIGDN